MVQKKLDPRIQNLLESGVKTHTRTMIVMIGDRGRDQVVNLHYMLSKAHETKRPSVLWCYKKDLGFSSHKQKRMKQLKTLQKRGLREITEGSDPFELFVGSTDISYVYYKDSQRVLGNTYGMCVLQDFEALTPNLLARTIETVEGGGLIVLLLKSMNSLKQFYEMTMDVHQRYRTESSGSVVARFNERFLLSLGDHAGCLVLDDMWNVLPISSGSRDGKFKQEKSTSSEELVTLKKELVDTLPIGALVEKTKTIDQAKAVLSLVDLLSLKKMQSTAAMTAGRGRGKSAAMGLSMAAAVAYDYSNIFVTSPLPENLVTFFKFFLKGLDVLGYQEHVDYDIIQSAEKCIVRINIFRTHRQTIQYIQPQDSHLLGQAELLIIDEAAAIPLPLVKKLLGNYIVIMASTIHGYEGTGRSLSLKLIQQLKTNVSRSLRELSLEKPIRYSEGDGVEEWLNKLLCFEDENNLNNNLNNNSIVSFPSLAECNLFNVNRDTLFSYHKASEMFLSKLMSLFVSAHYKNSPNDLQLLSDAPGHEIFVLLGPSDSNAMPEILCAIHVALEGAISKQSIVSGLANGNRGGGDLIPWTVSQQFQDDDMARLSGVRVVRIATDPRYQKMGYGMRAMELLSEFYQGKIICDENICDNELVDELVDDNSNNLVPKKRSNLPPLLLKLNEIKSPHIHWIGVSFGLTLPLLRFWKKIGMIPVYVRQTSNELTGEHTCIMLKTLNDQECSSDWLNVFFNDFCKRFISLLGFQFRTFSPHLAISLLSGRQGSSHLLSRDLLSFTSYDLKRLEAYCSNSVDYHLIMDLIPEMSKHLLLNQLDVQLSPVQTALMIGIGCQRKTIDELELNLPVNQLLAMLIKVCKKCLTFYRKLNEDVIVDDLEKKIESSGLDGLMNGTVADDESTNQINMNQPNMNEQILKQKELIKSLDISKFEIQGTEEDWKNVVDKMPTANLVSVGTKRAFGGDSWKELAQSAGKLAKKKKKNK